MPRKKAIFQILGLFLTMYMLLCVCLCIQRPGGDSGLHTHTPLHLLRQDLSLNQKFTDLARLTSQQAPGFLQILVSQPWDYATIPSFLQALC